MLLGYLRLEDYLKKVKGEVRGNIVTDAKKRCYAQNYQFKSAGSDVLIKRQDGHGDEVRLPKLIPLDESIVAFFGLYSGDGAKGSEDEKRPGMIKPTISFSQKEPNLVRFAFDQFKRLFSGNIRFTFSLGEDSAFFMDGLGRQLLLDYYGSKSEPQILELSEVRPSLDEADRRYLQEHRRDVEGTNEQHLAFYYFHKTAMEEILTAIKERELISVGIAVGPTVRPTASLRRPFKKGARKPGGTSRSDEIHIGGLNGLGELFLKIMHEIEDSLLNDSQTSTAGLVEWERRPSEIGQVIEIEGFFRSHPYGQIAEKRPRLSGSGIHLIGQWPRSTETILNRQLRITPLWCYTSGLYLAEGSTDKAKLFHMFKERVSGLAFGFTSSEGASIELMLRSLQALFFKDECLESWKIKVGSQYFPELVVIGMKQGVPMLRSSGKGEGKLRTMEISLALHEWALGVADEGFSPSLLRNDYADLFTHVEPTGSGVARIDFMGSSSLCRWYFPLMMYAVFGDIILEPVRGFYNA